MNTGNIHIANWINDIQVPAIAIEYTNNAFHPKVYNAAFAALYTKQINTVFLNAFAVALHNELAEVVSLQQLINIPVHKEEHAFLKDIVNIDLLPLTINQSAFVICKLNVSTDESAATTKLLAELNKTKELLTKAEAISKFGTWELNLIDNTLKWSDGVFRMCGYEPQSFVVDFNIGLSVIHPDDRASALEQMQRTIETGEEYKASKRLVTKEGEIVYIISRASLIKDKSGKSVKLFGVFQDITEEQMLVNSLNETNHQLQKNIVAIANQNKTFRKIAWQQSHVVRAPLSRILGVADLLQNISLDETEQRFLLESIAQSAAELDQIIKDITQQITLLETGN